MTSYLTTLPTSLFTSLAPHPSGFCSIRAMTMAAISPVNSKVAVTVSRLVAAAVVVALVVAVAVAVAVAVTTAAVASG